MMSTFGVEDYCNEEYGVVVKRRKTFRILVRRKAIVAKDRFRGSASN